MSSAEGGSDGDAKKSSEADTKNKRQIDQFVGSPGASFSSSLGYDAEQSPQAYPLQSTHGIYNQQQRLPLYTRRPIAANSKSPVLPEDDVIEQERQLQSQQQVCSNNIFHPSHGHCESTLCTLQPIAHN